MLQMIFKNANGRYQAEDSDKEYMVGESIRFYVEDEDTIKEGVVCTDENGEFYINTNGENVVEYMYEGMLVEV